MGERDKGGREREREREGEGGEGGRGRGREREREGKKGREGGAQQSLIVGYQICW